MANRGPALGPISHPQTLLDERIRWSIPESVTGMRSFEASGKSLLHFLIVDHWDRGGTYEWSMFVAPNPTHPVALAREAFARFSRPAGFLRTRPQDPS